MVQSWMMFCDYEGVVCVWANAYVNSLISDYETLAWCTFAAWIVVWCLLLNMFYAIKKIRKWEIENMSECE